MSFENHHVVAIVVFIVAMLFCKQVLECMHSFGQPWQACAASVGCCHYGTEELLHGGLLAALLTFSVCQPIIFVLVNNEKQNSWGMAKGRRSEAKVEKLKGLGEGGNPL